MKNFLSLLPPHRSMWLLPLLLLLTLAGCEKDKYNFEPGHRAPYLAPIDPAKQPDELNNALHLVNGTLKAGDIPAPTPGASLQIDNSQSGAIAAAGKNLYIPFTYAQANNIVGIYLQVDGAQHYWDLRVQNATLNASGNYVFPLGIPQQAITGNFSVNYALYDATGNVSQAARTRVGIQAQVQGCDDGQPYHESGSYGLTVRTIKLGNTAGRVNIRYDMYQLPDRMDIEYDSQWVASTGATLTNGQIPPSSICRDGQAGYVGGTGTLSFNYDPNKSHEFTIYMAGCYGTTFGTTAWDFWVDCPTTASGTQCTDNPFGDGKIQHCAMIIPGNQTGKWPVPLTVYQGDYVFVGAKGTLVCSPPMLPLPLSGGLEMIQSHPDGISGYTSNTVDPDYHYGQLMIHSGITTFGCDGFDLKGKNPGVPGELPYLNQVAFFNEWGNYFAAPANGQLSLELNDKTPQGNSLSYAVEVYVIPRSFHINRNCYNRCPRRQPTSTAGDDDDVYEDIQHNLWNDKGDFSNALTDNRFIDFDEIVENWYHGPNNREFRGAKDAVRGCQCVYKDSDGTLVNDASDIHIGTFDFGYSNFVPKSSVRMHHILDVFPHIVLNGLPTSTYAPTTSFIE